MRRHLGQEINRGIPVPVDRRAGRPGSHPRDAVITENKENANAGRWTN